MPLSRLLSLFAAICFISIFSGHSARAQSCTFSASDIIFDPVDLLGTAPTLGVGTLEVNCTTFLNLLSSITINIHLGDGTGGVSGSLRKMTNPQTTTGLAYQLYKDAARTQVFGGSYGSTGGTALTLTGASILQLLTTSGYSVPIYARIPAGQTNVIPNPTIDYSSAFTATTANALVTYRTCSLLLLCSDRTANFSFTVRARVPNDCMVNAGDMDFGARGLLDQDVTATSIVDVTCTAGSAFNVGLGYGITGSNINDRHMRTPQGNRVRYQLYKDQARTQPWGLPADGVSFLDTGTGIKRGLTVYGLVPQQTTPPPGSYSDTVTVTVTY